jgi:serpin B
MTKLLGPLVLLCSIAVACASSDTTVTVPADDPTAAEDPVAAGDPAATAATTTTTVLEPVADRLLADPDAPAGDWVAGVNAAGWDFHRHLEGNAVSSPMSIGVAFSMSRAGASADTGAALDQIFGFPETDPHSAANAVDLRLAQASAGTTTLEVANRLFPADNFSPLPEFLEVAAEQYGAVVQPVDTADGATAARSINRWVSDRTRGLVPTIVDADAVQDQKLVLVNTVYLKADWLEPFLPGRTSDRQFTTGDNQTVTVPFMSDREPMSRRFVRLAEADAVDLPYQGGELAMWLIVPHDPAGLPAVEEALDAEALTSLHSAAHKGLVDITMPKWEQTLPPADLFEWLCPQGFCAGAGFYGIAPGIFITAALHGAKVIVDEKGTEAAAVTAGVFAESGPPPADLTIVADRPFLWAIIHQDTGVLLFVGRLVDPTA